MNEPWYRRLFGSAPAPAPKGPITVADLQDSHTQFGLGLKYADGKEVAQDYFQAVEWYRKAAGQSHSLAQFNLGIMYANGRGVPRDDTTALMWIRKAAQQGDAAAQFDLGVRSQRAGLEAAPGEAVEPRIEAYKWLQLAAAQGYHGAAAACERVSLTMTHDDVTQGNQRVADFLAVQADRPAP
jgi:TPR repeat protein